MDLKGFSLSKYILTHIKENEHSKRNEYSK